MRVLTLVSIVLLMAAWASAAPIWSVDFESGFAASSGTTVVYFGNTSNPGDTTMDVHVEAGPITTSNNALDIENTDFNQPYSALAYSGIPGAIQPAADISISWRYYYAADEATRMFMPWTLSTSDGVTNGAPNQVHILFMGNPDTAWSAYLYAYDDWGKGGHYASKTFALPTIAQGAWHDFRLHWVYQGICQAETGALAGKPYANIYLTVNDECVGTDVMAWADWSAQMLAVGSMWPGGFMNYSMYQVDAAEVGDLIDDVVVTPEPATALLLLSGCVFFRKRK